MAEIRVNFRGRGWRWLLGDQDRLELWAGPELLAEISGALAVRILLHYLEAHELGRAVRPRSAAPPPTIEREGPELRDLRGRRLRRAA